MILTDTTQQKGNEIEGTIKLIREIILDPNCRRLNVANIKGLLGELYVKQLLEQEGQQVIHKTRSVGYDLEIYPGIRIDVKLSTIKGTTEYPDWGWTLQRDRQEKLTCTHIIGIGVNNDLEPERIVIIRALDMEQFPEVTGKYEDVMRSFTLMLDGFSYPNHPYFRQCQELVDQGVVAVLQPGDSLMDYLYE